MLGAIPTTNNCTTATYLIKQNFSPESNLVTGEHSYIMEVCDNDITLAIKACLTIALWNH